MESLSLKNKENLDLIEKSMFILVLDDDSPDTDSEVSSCNLCGDYRNRWADKAMMMIYYKNGRSGGVCDVCLVHLLEPQKILLYKKV